MLTYIHQNTAKSGRFIMGDDIGMWNIGAYHRGLMAGRTPNIDQLAREGAIFTMKQLEQMGVADNTIVVVGTDNGTEGFTWPDGGTTPFKGWKHMGTEGGFRVPCVIRWPGKVKPNQVINGVISGLDWFPTFVAAAGYEGDIVEDLTKGKSLNGKEYKDSMCVTHLPQSQADREST